MQGCTVLREALMGANKEGNSKQKQKTTEQGTQPAETNTSRHLGVELRAKWNASTSDFGVFMTEAFVGNSSHN